jgi:wyosine [tRNA(Phe)-imidazoG37] synthetase (radical SAM superfamily)
MQTARDPAPTPGLCLYRDHRRTFETNRHVYAVISRRCGGVSIGIDLCPDKTCNFDCVYCQVDRSQPFVIHDLEMPRLLEELEDMLDRVQSEALFQTERFRPTPPQMRRLRSIAFSGDGEPTVCPQFLPAAQAVADLHRRRGLGAVKLVLITNASRLHHPEVRQALALFDADRDEVWAKLDAGTEAYYRQVCRAAVPLQRILANITAAAQARPLIIQSLFLRMRGKPPPDPELEAYGERLRDITCAGGQIQQVQVYTVSREPAEPWVGPLSERELHAIAERIRQHTGLRADVFLG